MNVHDISIDKEKAKELHAHYWKQIKEKRNKEDEAIAMAYKAASKGLKLIDLPASMQKAGANDEGLPNLAIARADTKFVYYRNRGSEDPVFTTALRYRSPNFYCGNFHRTVLHGVDFPKLQSNDVFKAMVPIVPPQFRPKFKMSNYHILFEAVWTKEPPRDPFLLKHCGGGIYIVLAEWDLTEIERSVLRQRLT